MLGDYNVGRCSRQCFVEKRPLREGEWYYSVVLTGADDRCQRRDYSAQAWQGPPEGTLGFWKCRMPTSGERKLVLAPRGVLIDLLRQMESEPEQAKIRYLLALLLLRRRFVRLVDTEAASGGAVGAEAAGGRISGGEEAGAAVLPMMRLEVAEDGSTVDVLVCDISRSESETLSESLSELLYCEASEIDQEG